MSNIDKQAVQAVADLKAGYTLGHADVEIIQQMALDAVTLLDALEAAEKRIAELERDETQLIEERDSAEQALADMYEAAMGDRPEWSNLFGYSDAIDDVAQRISFLDIADAAGKGE